MKILRKLYIYWMKFAGFLGRVNSVIILTLLFVAAIGPYAIIKRIVDFFRRKPVPNTLWIDKKYIQPSIDVLERQF